MSLINLFVTARSALTRWRQRQRAYGELMALDDRSLSDIGIRRSQIRGIVEGFPAPARRAETPALRGRQAQLAAGHRVLPWV